MKAVYKIVSSIKNERGEYTPIQTLHVRRANDRRKRNPFNVLTVEINLVHGMVTIRAPHDQGLVVHPSIHGVINIYKK